MENSIKTKYEIRLINDTNETKEFKTYDDAVKYGKENYPNLSYKIVKISEETLVTVLLRK